MNGKTEKGRQEAVNRRGALRLMSAAVAGAFAAAPAVRASEQMLGSQSHERPKRPKPVIRAEGVSPQVVIDEARHAMGLEDTSDITSQISATKRRIGDTVVNGMTADQLQAEEKYFENYLPSVVLRLMDTGAYSHKTQVDMKFGIIEVMNVVSNAFRLLREGGIGAGEARLELRTGINYYLDYLAQLPRG